MKTIRFFAIRYELIVALQGIQSIQVYVAPEMTPWKCYLYTHFTPDCAGTLTIETLMSHDNGGFTCQDSVWGGGIHSFSYQCEGISP